MRGGVHISCCCRVECCTRCLAQGVTATHIIDGRQQHSLLMEMLTDEGMLMSPDAVMRIELCGLSILRDLPRHHARMEASALTQSGV